MQNDGDSVTTWIGEIRDGNSVAAQKLWERYYSRLAALARRKLGPTPRRVGDEEDVVVDAMNSFFQRAREQKFPLLTDRDNLWPLLVKITARKALKQRERLFAQKRGGGKVQGESVLEQGGRGDEERGIEQFVGHEPTAEFVSQLAEMIEQLMSNVDELTARVISHKLEGFSNRETSKLLDVHPRTVDRKLERIRKEWEDRLTS